MKLFFLGIASLVVLVSSAAGVTPENIAVGNLASLMAVYPENHNGLQLTGWDQVKAFYNLDAINRSLVGRQSYPIEDHYQFMNQELPLLGLPGSQILLIRTVPLRKPYELYATKDRQWRYLVYRRSDGEILSSSMSEDAVEKTLQKAGVTITPKAGLPAVETDERVSSKDEALVFSLAAVVLAGAVGYIVYRIRSRAKKTAAYLLDAR